MSQELIGINQSQLEKFKAEHKKVFCIEVEGDDNQKYAGYFKSPDINTLKAANKNLKNDEIDAGLTIYNNCKLWVSPEIEEDDMLKLSIMSKMSDIMAIKTATIKNL